jgi:magnesium transporter
MATHIKEHEFENFIWIDACQPTHKELTQLASEYDLDYYQISDSLQAGHLPKFETQPKYNFLILRAYTASEEDRVTNINELSNKIAFFYNDSKVITVHRSHFDFLDELNMECMHAQDLVLEIIRKMLHTFVKPSEILSREIDVFEQTIFIHDNNKISLEDLYYLKAETRIAKKILQITQNTIHQMEVQDRNKTSMQDIKDQLLYLILIFDEMTDDANSLLNTYLSVNAQKSNDVMRLLTIFSAFFLPLTFIAGIYGMNFDHMPELKHPIGYFATLGFMLGIALIIFLWFRRKRII